jgi:chromosome partitioning protein
MVDTDTQGQASALLGVRPEVGLAEFVSGDATFEEAATEVREGCGFSRRAVLAALKRVISRQEYGGERV